jgi:L-alanine-DL-glutamate epimerase-like enolase superfamily enzyme
MVEHSEEWERVRGLPLRVERCTFEERELETGSGFNRVTTLVHLEGGGLRGTGEDVTYEPQDQLGRTTTADALALAHEGTLESFSASLEGKLGFPHTPVQPASADYRRWAVESAALDLALRQAGLSAAEAFGREARPVRFALSMGLGNPPSVERLTRWLDGHDAGHRFKLDAGPEWDDALIAQLRELGSVDVVDLKGFYRGTVVDTPADPELYRRVAEGLPDVVIEDPWVDEATDAVLAPHRDRVAWDAPLHAPEDLDAMPFPTLVTNIKPSRFGTVERLLRTYAVCEARGIRMYGGGQFELDVGRRQIQLLAALFHPDGSNDVAPATYHPGVVRDDLQRSPLVAPSSDPGLG